jgi:hypothetical protein
MFSSLRSNLVRSLLPRLNATNLKRANLGVYNLERKKYAFGAVRGGEELCGSEKLLALLWDN